MGFKTMAISATAAGTILLSGLTFTGTIDLGDIKGFGQDWASKLTQAVDNSKEMASKFNLFKSDVETQLNEKIAKINELQARISELGEQVASGEVNLEDANNEIARLNEELEKANNEVAALKNEFALKDSEVQAAFNEMVTAESLDTTLSLDTQNPDAVVPEGSAPTEPTEEPQQEEPQNPYAAQETAIKDALSSKYAELDELQVTMTGSDIIISEPQLKSVENNYGMTYKTDIQNATGLTLGDASSPDANSYKFTYTK